MFETIINIHIPSLFPSWFLGVAAGIEIFCALVALAICFFGYRSYKLMDEKKLLYFSLAFFLIALNLLAHSLLNLAINFNFLKDILGKAAQLGIKLLLGSYFLLIIMVMLAYMSFIIIYSKTTRPGTIAMFYLLTLIIGVMSFQSYLKIHLISAILSGIIVFYTGMNYFKKRNTNSLLVFSAFSLITLFHLMFVLEHFNSVFYNIKYLILLGGFACFLTALLRVYYGRKKK